MTRLDQHVDSVRTRFLLQKLIDFGGWTVLCAALALLALTLATKLFAFPIPPKVLLIAGAGVLALFVALVLAIAYSPSREAAAVQIDLALGLKERFSTALVSRGSNDAFAQATVKDAETVANGVSIRRRFPFKVPKIGYYALGGVLVLVMADRFLPQWDLLGHKESERQAQVIARKREAAEKAVREALAEVMAIPKVGAQEKNIQAARQELQELLNQEIKDPVEATRTAQNALKEAESAREKIEENKLRADAKTQAEAFKSLANQQGSGLLEEAKKSLAEGKFDDAAKKLQGAVAKFEKADAATQQKMAAEMRTMADQLAKMAQEPATQERIQKELQKQGATPEQAREMTQEMAKAAAGDKNAQERVKNMAENLARRANGGVLPSPPQLAPLMQKMNQMQGQMNAQARQGDLAQAVNQLANAMQQSSQGQPQQSNQGQPSPQGQQSGKQANQQQGSPKQGQQSAQSGSQTGQQNSANQQSQQGQGNQQQAGQQQQGGQTDAQQAMEAAAAQLEAMQQAAEADAAKGGGQQGNGDNEGEGPGFGNQDQGPQGQPGQGQPNNAFSGPNAGGPGSGQRPKGVPTPFTVKKEVSPGEADQKGRIVASWLVKADSVKGESKEQLKQIIVSQQHDQADDVEQNRVPMRAQKAVRDYFQSLPDDVK